MRPKLIPLLLSAGARVNAQSDEGATAVHWACTRGSELESLSLLLDAG